MAEEFTEGWTDPIRYQLLKEFAPFDASGSTVVLEAYDREFNVVTLAGTVDWENVALSIVRYEPLSSDLKASDSLLHTRFKLTDALGHVTHFPKGVWEDWIIRR